MDFSNFVNNWDKSKWLAKKDLLKDCVWCEGALLEHEREVLYIFRLILLKSELFMN